MEKFKIIIKDNGTFLRKENPYPKILIKNGIPHKNHEHDSFERKSIKKAKLLINPIENKTEYLKDELELIWQLYDHGAEQWENYDKNTTWEEFKSKHGHKITRKVYTPKIYQKDNSISRIVKVYIASPYTIGDVAVNVRDQIETADKLMDLGFAPFVPLYSHFQHMMYPRPYEDWIKLDKVWVLSCDALLRFGGESKGADGEVELAKSVGIPVFYNIESLIIYFSTLEVKNSLQYVEIE